MKEGWNNKPFESCLERVPKTKKIPTSSYRESGTYPIVSQEDGLISGYWNDSGDLFHITHPVVIFGDHTRVLKYIDFDFVIGADGVKVLSPKSDIAPKFLYYYLSWSNIPSLGYSRHYKLLKELSFPVPPLPEQERIVAELDLLTGIIDKQKAQLKELDTLAQSIFYDMFGDPESNEKGWDIKKLSDIGKVITGNTPSTKDEKNYSSDDYCFVKPSDIVKDGISIISDSEYHISAYGYESSRKLPKGSILTTCIGVIGKVGILSISATCNQQINAIIPNDSSESMYVAYCIIGKRRTLESIANAPVVPIINKGDFSNISIPVPPLSLQQSFAQKIQSIESQKESINRSISETQKLFEYTMDKYFG